jgi:hypothetical protein
MSVSPTPARSGISTRGPAHRRLAGEGLTLVRFRRAAKPLDAAQREAGALLLGLHQTLVDTPPAQQSAWADRGG